MKKKHHGHIKELKNIFDEKNWAFLPKRPGQGVRSFLAKIKNVLQKDVYEKPDKMIEAILEAGYRTYCIANFENAKDRIDDLRELVNFAHTYNSLKDFLADACLGESFKGETILEPSGFSQEHLVLSTIHQAKGLEWDVVFLIGLIDNQFPHPKSEDDPAQFEEERRLFYVAATRARRELYLLHSVTRFDYNYGTVISRPSLFLTELNENRYEEWKIEDESLATAW